MRSLNLSRTATTSADPEIFAEEGQLALRWRADDGPTLNAGLVAL